MTPGHVIELLKAIYQRIPSNNDRLAGYVQGIVKSLEIQKEEDDDQSKI